MRLSIDVTAEQHKKLKAIAAIQGKSIKEYVLEKSLPKHSTNYHHDRSDEEETLRKLESLLETRNDDLPQKNSTESLERMVYDLIGH